MTSISRGEGGIKAFLGIGKAINSPGRGLVALRLSFIFFFFFVMIISKFAFNMRWNIGFMPGGKV